MGQIAISNYSVSSLAAGFRFRLYSMCILIGRTSIMTRNRKMPEKWNDGHSKPQHGQCLPSPLPIATMTPTITWSKTPATGSSLPRPPTWTGSLATSMQCVTFSTVAQEGSHHWAPLQDLPFDEVIRFGYAANHSSRQTCVCLPSGLYHARSGRVLQQSGPNQEVTRLPGIYFFDEWRVRLCMHISTDLPQSRDPPERDVQRPAATATTTESSQTPDEEARDILAKALRN